VSLSGETHKGCVSILYKTNQKNAVKPFIPSFTAFLRAYISISSFAQGRAVALSGCRIIALCYAKGVTGLCFPARLLLDDYITLIIGWPDKGWR
jgi:hypothetical protein